MPYAVLQVRDFALHALVLGEAELVGKPVAVVAGEGKKAAVLEASREAVGVEPGLPVTLAMARCPGIVLRPRDPEAESMAHRLLLAAAFTLSPRVELTSAGRCTVDLQGADLPRTEGQLRLRLAELSLKGLPSTAGVASTPLLASFASRCADPLLVVRDERAFLAPLPLSFAEPTPEHAQILQSWGLRTLGELTALPKGEISRRLGAEGAALWERAAGETERVLKLFPQARHFAAEWEYDPPVETMEPLLFRLKRYSECMALELRAAGLVAQALSLTLLLEDDTEHRRKFSLAEPGADAELWLRVLFSHLETVRTPARVAGVRLVAEPARPVQKQDGLFDTGLRDPAAFWENLARVAAVVGEGWVGTPALVDTHRPDSFVMERPAEAVPPSERPPVHPPRGLVLRRFRPAWPARVLLEQGRPVRLECPAFLDDVTTAQGPRLLSGDWWRSEPWSVESWLVELRGGGLYQIAHTPGEGWFVEGILD